MKRLFITRSALTGKVIESYAHHFFPLQGGEIVLLPCESNGPHAVTWVFNEICRRLDALSLSDAADQFGVMVDIVSPDHLHPNSADPWSAAISMAVLCYPDVRWIFVHACKSTASIQWESIAAHHSLSRLGDDSVASDLCDGSGLREWIRNLTRVIAPYLPQRRMVSASLDEEAAYAVFHSYLAYRNGFRAFALTTDNAASGLLFSKNLDLTFEDIYLNFYDKRPNRRYASLSERGELFPAFERANWRYFITVGHRFGADQGLFSAENQEILRRLREEDRGGVVLTKPVAGMHAIWRETGLERKLEWFDAEDDGRRRIGVGDGYAWPPRLPREGELEPGGHSAPGRLIQIAEHLVHRAESMVNEVRSVRDAVRGAVLAADALELLGCRTPTLARDALELKHRFEVMAECQFGGVEFNLNLESRFGEIRRDMEAICVWFGADHRQSSLLNGELTIISRLLTVFRDYNEYDEEDTCLKRIRELQTEIWTRKQGAWIFLTWPICLIRAYVEAIVGSPQRLALVILGWMGVIFLGVYAYGGGGSVSDVPDALATSIKSFFGGEPDTVASPANQWMLVTITSIGAVLGFLHLGVFIARLYSIVSRK
jgi:hypothetical protein